MTRVLWPGSGRLHRALLHCVAVLCPLRSPFALWRLLAVQPLTPQRKPTYPDMWSGPVLLRGVQHCAAARVILYCRHMMSLIHAI